MADGSMPKILLSDVAAALPPTSRAFNHDNTHDHFKILSIFVEGADLSTARHDRE